MRWEVTTFLLCVYGFLKRFRPTEPYLYQYEHETLNISAHVLTSEVFPIWTYSYMMALVPVLLLSDLVLYKPIIIIESLSYILAWTLLTFFGTVFAQQMVELFYGWATATEVAYFAYIYVKVPRNEFKRVTSYTRSALLLGSFMAYTTAQLIVLLRWGTYETLNTISLMALSISFFFTIALPPVPWKEAYEKKRCLKDQTTATNKAVYKDYVGLHFKTFIGDIKTIYGNPFMMKWSLWWALASCVYFQVANYVQTLWGTLIGANDSNVYNGLTEAVRLLVSLPAVFFMQHLRVNWSRWGELTLVICSIVNALILFWLSQTNSLFVMYSGHIAYKAVYEGMITITQSNLAEGLETASFGLVFGMNTFFALVLQTLLTLVVNSSLGLALTIRPQFIVYAGFHIGVSLLFMVPLTLRLGRSLKRRLRRKAEDVVIPML